jgi:hypothetical protein
MKHKISSTLVPLVAILGIMSFSPALPAAQAATGYKFTYEGSQGQVDNRPGNGKAGWAWVWDADPASSGSKFLGHYQSVELRVHLYNGTDDSIEDNSGSGHSKSWGSPVQRAQLCAYSGNSGNPQFINCGKWHYFDR